MFDPEITQADQEKAEEIISNSVANGFTEGLIQAVKENNITSGGGAIGDAIINSGNNVDNSKFDQIINNIITEQNTMDDIYIHHGRGSTGDGRR